MAKKLIVIVLLSLITASCGNCREEVIPFFWVDGSVTYMTIMVCDPDE